ncbi:MAG: hypothetical protein HQM11_13160 [SAR324 cluster bacterium]|nr:hypothetical protein [SAR324 cluster bacterium]
MKNLNAGNKKMDAVSGMLPTDNRQQKPTATLSGPAKQIFVKIHQEIEEQGWHTVRDDIQERQILESLQKRLFSGESPEVISSEFETWKTRTLPTPIAEIPFVSEPDISEEFLQDVRAEDSLFEDIL